MQFMNAEEWLDRELWEFLFGFLTYLGLCLDEINGFVCKILWKEDTWS